MPTMPTDDIASPTVTPSKSAATRAATAIRPRRIGSSTLLRAHLSGRVHEEQGEQVCRRLQGGEGGAERQRELRRVERERDDPRCGFADRVTSEAQEPGLPQQER